MWAHSEQVSESSQEFVMWAALFLGLFIAAGAMVWISWKFRVIDSQRTLLRCQIIDADNTYLRHAGGGINSPRASKQLAAAILQFELEDGLDELESSTDKIVLGVAIAGLVSFLVVCTALIAH